ncbi:MAG TPA: hypothetical protein VG963_14125 [Polyangiaceae bacterium]|nr:hypothetical protein [Polyangiaceae bacterium]
MTGPSIATDSCHHPTVKAKAYSLVQLFFLLICIISMLLSLMIRFFVERPALTFSAASALVPLLG